MTDIGKTLQNARNEKHYTLDDLQQITKIQKRYLIAIEENNFDALPGDFYVRAFIRQYADTVGIKADKLLSELDEQAGKKKVEETEEEPTEAKTRTEAVRRQQQSSTPSQVSQSFDKLLEIRRKLTKLLQAQMYLFHQMYPHQRNLLRKNLLLKK